MIEDYKYTVTKHFNSLFKKYGVDVRSLDWGSDSGQKIRFDILMQFYDITNLSVLDLGCGLGDFYPYLINHGFKGKYTGIDLNESFINEAKRRYSNTEFLVEDILQKEFNRKFDVIFASGIFYLKYKDNLKFYDEMITKLLDLTTVGIAFNLLSSYCKDKKENEFYFDPEWVVSNCIKNKRKFTLRCDYKPNDITVYIFK